MSFLPEQKSEGKRKAVVMVGRLNPPTAGHYHVMDQMKKYIRTNEHGVKSGVIVLVDGEETGKDKTKNPLTADERKRFLKASGHADAFEILVAPNGFDAFKVAREAGYEPITIAAGSDRADRYIETMDKHFGTDDNGKTIKHYKVPGLERNEEDEVPEGEIDIKKVSASMARHAAELGYLEEFTEIAGLTDKPKLAKILFDKVRSAMKETNESI